MEIKKDFRGPSKVTRTPGILLPKQARYQLRYTRMYTVGLNHHTLLLG